MTENIIKRFIKDFSLPIQVTSPEYFDYFKNLYSSLYDIPTKERWLNEAISQAGSEEKFIDVMSVTRNKIIESIKETEAYNAFIDYNNPDFLPNGRFAISQEIEGVKFSKSSDIYNHGNADKEFISIDLCKANFQTLKYYNPDIVFGANTYEEFISIFSDFEYLKQSKYLRQVIFGNLNVGRQITIEKFLTSKVLGRILNFGVSAKDVLVFTNDEIVFRADGYSEDDIRNFVDGFDDINAKVTKFKLVQIEDKDFYVKELSNGTKTFKKVPVVYFAQAFKKYFGYEIEDRDLLFVYEGRMAKLLESIF